jgi:hypothetical protein
MAPGSESGHRPRMARSGGALVLLPSALLAARHLAAPDPEHRVSAAEAIRAAPCTDAKPVNCSLRWNYLASAHD